MNRFGYDPKVKKTLVRDCEKKVRPPVRKLAVHDVDSSPKLYARPSGSSLKENKLNKPTLCSSEVLASYLTDVRVSAPPPLTAEDLNVDKSKICAKVTKKLNFHFNDRIYKNLIELNANVEDNKKKKKRPLSSTTSKRDMEPNIEDFCEESKDDDYPPNIPVIKPKFSSVKRVDRGEMHKLVAAFEIL